MAELVWYVHARRGGRCVNLPARNERHAHGIAGNLCVDGWLTHVKSVEREDDTEPPTLTPTPIHYRNGMSFKDFQELLARRNNERRSDHRQPHGTVRVESGMGTQLGGGRQAEKH